MASSSTTPEDPLAGQQTGSLADDDPGVLAGGIVAALVLLAIIVTVVVVLLLRKRQKGAISRKVHAVSSGTSANNSNATKTRQLSSVDKSHDLEVGHNAPSKRTIADGPFSRQLPAQTNDSSNAVESYSLNREKDEDRTTVKSFSLNKDQDKSQDDQDDILQKTHMQNRSDRERRRSLRRQRHSSARSGGRRGVAAFATEIAPTSAHL